MTLSINVLDCSKASKKCLKQNSSSRTFTSEIPQSTQCPSCFATKSFFNLTQTRLAEEDSKGDNRLSVSANSFYPKSFPTVFKHKKTQSNFLIFLILCNLTWTYSNGAKMEQTKYTSTQTVIDPRSLIVTIDRSSIKTIAANQIPAHDGNTVVYKSADEIPHKVSFRAHVKFPLDYQASDPNFPFTFMVYFNGSDLCTHPIIKVTNCKLIYHKGDFGDSLYIQVSNITRQNAPYWQGEWVVWIHVIVPVDGLPDMNSTSFIATPDLFRLSGGNGSIHEFQISSSFSFSGSCIILLTMMYLLINIA